MTTRQQITAIQAGNMILDGNRVLQQLYSELKLEDQIQLMEAIKPIVEAGSKLMVIFQQPCNDIQINQPVNN